MARNSAPVHPFPFLIAVLIAASEGDSGVALFIVARIQLYRDDAGGIASRGGTVVVLDP
jgi:hypothetical protein